MSDQCIKENFPHHYIIVVVADNLNSKTPGRLRLKYVPIYFHHDEFMNIEAAMRLSKDKVYKTNRQDAIRIHNCQEMVTTLSMLKISAMSNNGSCHHFYSEYKISDPEKFFDDFVNRANKDERTKKQLMDSIIRL